MRFAIPVTDDKTAAHFGHCSHFALFDIDDKSKTVVRKEVVPSPGHQPGFLPVWLAEQGVSVVIATGMGSRAQAIFDEHRIKVVIGACDDDPAKLVTDYLNGKLVTGQNICDH